LNPAGVTKRLVTSLFFLFPKIKGINARMQSHQATGTPGLYVQEELPFENKAALYENKAALYENNSMPGEIISMPGCHNSMPGCRKSRLFSRARA